MSTGNRKLKRRLSDIVTHPEQDTDGTDGGSPRKRLKVAKSNMSASAIMAHTIAAAVANVSSPRVTRRSSTLRWSSSRPPTTKKDTQRTDKTPPPQIKASLSKKIGGATDPGKRYGTLNQDAYFHDWIFVGGSPVYIVGVFDGHGKHGEKAAQIAKDYFHKKLRKLLKSWGENKPDLSLEYFKNLFNKMYEDVHQAIINSYDSLPTLEWDGHVFELTFTSDNVGVYQSPTSKYALLQDFGTTATVCLYFKEQRVLIVSNCGDSDALLCRRQDRSSLLKVQGDAAEYDEVQWQPFMLTVSDNIINNTKDVERILKTYSKKTKIANGYLSPNSSQYGFHSLAMTRALGHKFLQNYGVSHVPHVSRFELTPDDKLLIVASDGLFDVVSKEDIVAVASAEHANMTEASKRLVELAMELWCEADGGDFADNTTVVVVDLS